jgi:hypothetical protein
VGRGEEEEVEEEEEDQEEEEEEGEKREKEEISQKKKKLYVFLPGLLPPKKKYHIGELGEVSLVWKKKNLQPRSLSYPDWNIKYTTHPGVYWSAD